MPKGVEHKVKYEFDSGAIGCVESLMPKGVEHALFSVWIVYGISVESLMPKGVEHKSQKRSHQSQKLSVESLMPKGVEHQNLCSCFFS